MGAGRGRQWAVLRIRHLGWDRNNKCMCIQHSAQKHNRGCRKCLLSRATSIHTASVSLGFKFPLVSITYHYTLETDKGEGANLTCCPVKEPSGSEQTPGLSLREVHLKPCSWWQPSFRCTELLGNTHITGMILYAGPWQDKPLCAQIHKRSHLNRTLEWRRQLIVPLSFQKHRKDRSRSGMDWKQENQSHPEDGLRKTNHIQRTESKGGLLLWGRNMDTVMNGKYAS